MGVLELTLALTPPARLVTWEQLMHRRRFPRDKQARGNIGQAASRDLAISPARDISPLVSSGGKRKLWVEKMKAVVIRTGPHYLYFIIFLSSRHSLSLVICVGPGAEYGRDCPLARILCVHPSVCTPCGRRRLTGKDLGLATVGLGCYQATEAMQVCLTPSQLELKDGGSNRKGIWCSRALDAPHVDS
jgi:hypothetical protein